MCRQITLLVLLVVSIGHGLAGTVLTVITPGPKSHLFGMKKITTELAARGHRVAFLAAETDAVVLRPTEVPIIQYSVQFWKGLPHRGSIEVAGPQGSIGTVAQYQPIIDSSCESLMANASVLARVEEFAPDLLLATMVYPCSSVLASRLDVPFVNYFPAAPIEPFITSFWPDSNRRLFTSNPLAYTPQMETDIATQYMTFPQRLQNFFQFWRIHLLDYLYVHTASLATYKKFGINLSDPKERRRMVLTICNADFAIEWVRPMPPNFKMIGPVLPEPAKPLPADVEEFMDGSGERGVLFVAMGTVATLGLEERQAMAAAFAELPVRVLWRLSKTEVPDQTAVDGLHLGNNTKLATWLPQNDVLGHPRTRAFLSHCGANSLYEAAYHGVPVAALPFFGDQPGNAAQAVARGMAVRVRHADIGTEAFPVALRLVLLDGSYAAAAKRVSVKLRARPRTPTQEAGDWVEHVLATGGDAYLHTPDQDLPLYVRLSLDMWAIVLAAAAVLLYTALKAVQLAAATISTAMATNGSKSKAV